MARHLCSQASVLSTTHRLALRRLRPRLSSFSSPIRRMCVIYPASSAASTPVGLSYPLSKQRCCSTSSGSGRSRTMESMVASRSLQSCRFAPSSTAAKGPPSASTNMLFFVPDFPRSVGFGPVFSPTETGFVGAAVGGLPLPIKTTKLITFGRQFLPDALEETTPHPDLKPVMNAAVVAEFQGKMIPLATGTHTENHGFKDTAKINRPLAPNGSRRAKLLEHRTDTLPQIVRNGPDGGHRLSMLWHWLSPLIRYQLPSDNVDIFKGLISR